MRGNPDLIGQAAQRDAHGQMPRAGGHSQAASGIKKIHTQYTQHSFCIGIGDITMSYLRRSAQLWRQWITLRLKHHFQPLSQNVPQTLIRPGRRPDRRQVHFRRNVNGHAKSKFQRKEAHRPRDFSSKPGVGADRLKEKKAKPWSIPRPSLRPIPYLRIGEASHPGPVIRMPGDGHCLYHSLGWWASLSQNQVRDQLARVDWNTWKTICPWDKGSELSDFRRETKDPTVWGGSASDCSVRRHPSGQHRGGHRLRQAVLRHRAVVGAQAHLTPSRTLRCGDKRQPSSSDNKGQAHRGG